LTASIAASSTTSTAFAGGATLTTAPTTTGAAEAGRAAGAAGATVGGRGAVRASGAASTVRACELRGTRQELFVEGLRRGIRGRDFDAGFLQQLAPLAGLEDQDLLSA